MINNPQDLFGLAYQELKRLARAARRRVSAHETINTTALVNEAYLKLSGGASIQTKDAAHLRALISRAMRQILVDRARRRVSAKHGAVLDSITLEHLELAEARSLPDLLALNQMLEHLSEIDARMTSIVEQHVFGGMTFAEIASGLALTERTVFREWRKARALMLTHWSGTTI